MKKLTDDEPTEPIIAHFRLESAFLIRCFSNGREHYYILEDVATRQRHHFENMEALMAWLEDRV